MADPGQEYNKIVVTSAKGRSLFSLCPSRAPRVVADEDSTLTHFVLRLCAIGDIEDFLKVLLHHCTSPLQQLHVTLAAWQLIHRR